jgi:hypothetical protein
MKQLAIAALRECIDLTAQGVVGTSCHEVVARLSQDCIDRLDRELPIGGGELAHLGVWFGFDRFLLFPLLTQSPSPLKSFYL